METLSARRDWLDDVAVPGHPRAVAAVAFAAIGMLLLLLGLGTRPDAELLPGNAIVYAVIG